MNEERSSYRRILVSTSLVGGATAVTIIIGLVRTKLFALAVGPAGIGLIGVLGSIVATAAAVGGMGLGFSGVRQIAAAGERNAWARRALWAATWPLALLSAAIVWLWRDTIARLVIGSEQHGLAVGVGAAAVALTIVGASQLAVLQGLRRISELARARIYGALLATVIAVPAVLYLGYWGLVIAVLAVPLGNAVAALPYLPSREAKTGPASSLLGEQWRNLFQLGLVVMVTGTLATAATVAVRAIIIQDGGGIAAAGLYQAAYAISAMNVALVLTAMAADYFPRLTAVSGDTAAANLLMNQQLRAALLLGAPLLAIMSAASPLVLHILYSGQFVEGAQLLRWQVAGDLLKLPGWALGFVLVARRDAAAYLAVETAWVLIYVAVTLLLLPRFGLEAAGVAYAAAYGCYSVVLAVLCRFRHSMRVSGANLRFLALLLPIMTLPIILAQIPAALLLVVGIAIAAGLALHAVRELDALADARLAARLRKHVPFGGRAGS